MIQVLSTTYVSVICISDVLQLSAVDYTYSQPAETFYFIVLPLFVSAYYH